MNPLSALSAPALPGAPTRDPAEEAREASLRAVAAEFESVFLAQMLQHAGAGRPPEAMGGGHGEAAFASLLTAEHARLMTEAGGIGLADTLYRALARRDGDRP
mgnify:CR=1 FL=1